jgi:primosomal replication protein N
MNRVFLAGTLKTRPEVAYTPKGKKIIMFRLWVEDGAFDIEVVYLERQGVKNIHDAGSTAMVSGMLAKASKGSHDVFRLKANNIVWMEE